MNQQQQQQQPNSNLSSNSSSNSASSPLTKEEKDLIRDLSSKYKELKEKNPAFDSKSFITHELTTRCGPQRAREIMDYMQKMSKSKVAQANQAVQHSQMSAVPAPQQLQQQQHFSNFQQTNQLSRGPQTSQIPNSGLFLNNANSFHPNVSVPRQQHIPNQMYTQMKNQSGQQTMLPSQQQQLLQQQHQQQQQQYHSQSGMNVFTSNKDPIIKREGQQNNNQNDLGLDAAPKLEDLQADLTTIAEKHIQLNILSEKEINVESDAADGSLRKSLAEEDKSTIPGVGVIARPNMTIDNPAPRSLALQTNVLDEVGINSAVANLGKPQIQITNEAAILLSEGIQMHLSQLIDAAIVHSRKRTNRTATEHFHKTLGLIEKEAPYSGRGEIFPENRGNLGMLWGPPRMEELEEYTLRVNDQYNEKRIRLVENLVEEMKNDDDKRLQKKKGQGAPNTDIPKDAWWLRDDKYRESGGASLEDLAMMRFKYDVAKKYELGPFNTRKKPKKDDEVDEEVSTVEVFTPSFRPNPVIRYENIPLTKSTWTRQPCPLLEREKNGSLTLTQSDIISAISKNRGNDLGSTRGNIDFGTSLRIAKSSVLQRR